MQTDKPYTLSMSRIGGYTTGNFSLLNPYQAGVIQYVRARDMLLPTSGAIRTLTSTVNSTVRFSGDDTAPVDITKIARVDGATVYNNNAGANNGTDGAVGTGMFVSVGTAVGSWKRMGTTGGAGNQY